MLSTPDWWNDLPGSLAFDVGRVPPAFAPFYVCEGMALAAAMHQSGATPLPKELRTDSTYLTLGYFAYHWLNKKSEWN
jgi:hypothetical protein